MVTTFISFHNLMIKKNVEIFHGCHIAINPQRAKQNYFLLLSFEEALALTKIAGPRSAVGRVPDS